MKKTKIALFVIGLFCSLFIVLSPAYADSSKDVVVSLQINNPIMEINGVETEIDIGRGTKPVISDGRTLVPIRAIIEAFGGLVLWDENTQSVLLTMNDDVIRLVINSSEAYLNDKTHNLDVAPSVINGRTMLPLRFVAEGFNLGVAWDGDEQTVSVIKNTFDESEYEYLMSVLPAYSGPEYTQINNNQPLFKDYEIIDASFEYYSDLDELGRCDVCFACVSKEIMPTSDREGISSVTPSGWMNAFYDNIDGGYLYNRCHLIGYQLTGENANERNLITGTRYLNIEGMLPFENEIARYVENTGNKVVYRSTPVFSGDNLVADGVLLEAYSVEDNGNGLSFCVYCYNVQPQISIDYLTGESSLKNEPEIFGDNASVDEGDNNTSSVVYRTPSGKKYHYDPQCGGKNSFQTSLDDAINSGLDPCAKCSR